MLHILDLKLEKAALLTEDGMVFIGNNIEINPMGHQIVLKELLFLKLCQKEKRIYEK